MNYLVTGCAGFIGFHLCKELLARGNLVWGLDNLDKGNIDRVRLLQSNERFTFTESCLSGMVNMRRLLEKTDVIYHLAAVVGVKRYVENPVEVVKVNVCYTSLLLELAWELRKKVVFASTSEVYGKSDRVPFHENCDRVYGPSITDRWCYAVSKSAAEHLCFGYLRQGLPVVIVRYFNVYGPGADSSDYGGVVTRFIKQLLTGQPLTVHGDGSQTRSFTFIEDAVKGTIEAGSRPGAEGRVFNLGHRRETSILELARFIMEVSAMEGRIVFQPHEQFYGPHYQDIARRIPDLTAAEQLLGYYPATGLEEGLARTVEYYRKIFAVKENGSGPLH